MSKLSEQHCEACRADAPTVSQEEAAELQRQIPEWERLEVEGVPQLQRVFRLKNFAEAMAFANRVGELAEEQGHHPALLVEYGRLTVRWWTHKIGGLHRNDYIMAARTDALDFGE